MAAKFNKPWFDFLHARAMGEGAHDGITGLYEMMDQDEFNRTYLKLIKQTIAGYDERLNAFREKLKVVCRAVSVDWKEALRLLVDESEYEDTISYLFSIGLSDEQVVDICEKYFPASKEKIINPLKKRPEDQTVDEWLADYESEINK